MSRLRESLAGIHLDALSIAGVETCIQLPEYRIAFDVGRCRNEVVQRRTIFLTHAHMDHFSGLAYHAGMRSMRGMDPARYVVPPSTVGTLQEYFEVVRRLDGGAFPCEILPLGPGERYVLRPDTFVTSFATDHRIASQGYVLWDSRRKLRAPYRDLPGPEIARLRKEGADIAELIETPHLAFTGDTLVDVLDREEVLRRARVLMIEVTFVGDHPTVADARSRGHVHLDEIAARADLFQNEHLVLLHFSTRYTRQMIEEEVRRALPPSLLARVHLSVGG